MAGCLWKCMYGLCNVCRRRRRWGCLFSSEKGEKGIMFECVCVPRFIMKNRKLDCIEEYRRKSIATRLNKSIATRINKTIATRITNRIAMPITILWNQDVWCNSWSTSCNDCIASRVMLKPSRYFQERQVLTFEWSVKDKMSVDDFEKAVSQLSKVSLFVSLCTASKVACLCR